MARMMPFAARSILTIAVVLGAAGGAMAQTGIGNAERVENRVEGEVNGMAQPVVTDARVFQNERITTYAESGATLRFLDATTMSMGATSEVILDRFVFDPDRSTGDIVFNVAKGAFRFVTGNAPSGSYRVVTPHAVIGTRGTDYGVYSLALGSLALAHSGHAFACPLFLINDPDPGGPGCCSLDADAAGGPVYGIMARGSNNCIGPRRWTGTNPFLLLSRRSMRDRVNDRDPDDPPSRPSPRSSPPESNGRDGDDNGGTTTTTTIN